MYYVILFISFLIIMFAVMLVMDVWRRLFATILFTPILMVLYTISYAYIAPTLGLPTGVNLAEGFTVIVRHSCNMLGLFSLVLFLTAFSGSKPTRRTKSGKADKRFIKQDKERKENDAPYSFIFGSMALSSVAIWGFGSYFL